MLDDAGVAISMDGKGRWIDNVFIERLWRSVKYEEVYLHGYATGTRTVRKHALRSRSTSAFTTHAVLIRPSSTGHRTRCTSKHSRPQRPWQPER